MAPWRWFKCKPKHVGDFKYFNKLKFYSVKWKSVHVLVIIMDIMYNLSSFQLQSSNFRLHLNWNISLE